MERGEGFLTLPAASAESIGSHMFHSPRFFALFMSSIQDISRYFKIFQDISAFFMSSIRIGGCVQPIGPAFKLDEYD